MPALPPDARREGRAIDPYTVLLVAIGLLILALAGLPLLVRTLPLSAPVVLLLAGAGLGLAAGRDFLPVPGDHPDVTERLTEIVVAVALAGAGLKLDTPFGWRRWNVTWRLLGVTLPLSIAGISLVGWAMLGLTPAAALLLGAVLAPTDPALASDVQVGPPGSDRREHRVRFALTSEAGVNDVLVFPFVYLALGIAMHGLTASVLAEWGLSRVLWALSAGVAVGLAVGRLSALLLFRKPLGVPIARSRAGFVVVGVSLVAYGVTELVAGYGFLGVFVAALTLRSTEREHEYHAHLHGFAEEIEALAMGALILCIGAGFATAVAPYLEPVTVLAALAIVLVVRPLAGAIGLAGGGGPLRERLAIAFFGIRGVGSIYYLAYAIAHHDWPEAGLLWTVTITVIVLSILIHGITATPVMRRIDPVSGAASPDALH